ncbi:MAG: cell division protein ZapA [Deltaproteobacteria bacterium]|nr:cell division protein ZapA [Deltaproteobacteria bacterium]MBW1932530.1 cell division protein ZapA [Deltaproteobacteria bacterium]MBW1938451.1 cell division protein ZapA [Deltaproteobacteria bacterium]MBW1963869.1 cell division protein ZapA [Deltaproteobacteria bacterium]MBW2079909.1 cell division protein ZapA [Deltaproteobacteria bacterium]
METTPIKFNFFGQMYELKEDDPEVDVKEVVEYVEAKVREQEISNKGLATHKMVVLAMLNIGKDYILARHQLRQLKETVVSKTSLLVAKIDSAID